ncbi:MAG: single-stranded DNA-binding protein [Rhodospirillaceae bacterium]
MLNKVELIGRLGGDPEVRHTQNSGKVAHLSVATSEAWKDRQTGERRERTEWHRVVIFSPPLIDFAERHLGKGMLVYIEGQLQTRKWQDQTNQTRFATEVVLNPYRSRLTLLDRPNGNGGAAEPPPPADLDDEIPY